MMNSNEEEKQEAEGDELPDEGEPEEFEPEEETADKVKKLREKLKECEKEKQEYLDGWQRAKADFVNSRRRLEEEKAAALSKAGEEVLLEILPVVDSFEMAFADRESWEQAPSEWRKGVESIYSQLTNVLKRHNVSAIDPEAGTAFDPQQHEAMEMVPVSDEADDHTVQAVLQKGYRSNGGIIRAAKVKVGEYQGS